MIAEMREVAAADPDRTKEITDRALLKHAKGHGAEKQHGQKSDNTDSLTMLRNTCTCSARIAGVARYHHPCIGRQRVEQLLSAIKCDSTVRKRTDIGTIDNRV